MIVQDFFLKDAADAEIVAANGVRRFFVIVVPLNQREIVRKDFFSNMYTVTGPIWFYPLSQFRSKVNVIFFFDWFLRKNTPIPSVIISYI